MTARMKPPVHCEICGDSSKHMFPLRQKIDLEEYGVCIFCMHRQAEHQLEILEGVQDKLEQLVYDYPPLEEEYGDLLEGLSKLAKLQ